MTVRKYSAEGARLRAGFTAVPNIVLRDTALSMGAKALYATFLDLAWREAEPEQAELAGALGVSEKPLRKLVRELEDAGLVTVKRRGQGKTNAYVVHEPGEVLIGRIARTGTGESPVPSLKDLEQDKEVEANASTSRTGTIRKRDVVFDAMVQATAANPADGGMIGKAIKAIRTAEHDRLQQLAQTYLAENPADDEVPKAALDKVLAELIEERAQTYKRMRPDWELTPTALAKHWNRIPTWRDGGDGRLSPAEIAKL